MTDDYGRYLKAVRDLKVATRRLERLHVDEFYSLPDQGGWHIMCRVATAADELLEETEALELYDDGDAS